MRIVFMGTPDFAVPSLAVLHENGFEVVGVITAPDKPKGRGKVLQGTPVKEYALANGLRVLQPTNLKSESFLEELRALRADLQVVVAFRMLPEIVWSMPEQGTFNLHASLLPNYRGAAPINWAVINGEKETGATTFFLKHEIDTGNVIAQIKEPIYEEDTAGDLYGRLMENGSQLVLETAKRISQGDVKTSPQQWNDSMKPAPKIFKETCEINWNQNAEVIRNFVRGMAPFPAAWTRFGNKSFKIFKLQQSERNLTGLIEGAYKSDGKTFLSVKVADGAVDILELQMEGKKRMIIEDLLRGYKFE